MNHIYPLYYSCHREEFYYISSNPQHQPDTAVNSDHTDNNALYFTSKEYYLLDTLELLKQIPALNEEVTESSTEFEAFYFSYYRKSRNLKRKRSASKEVDDTRESKRHRGD